MVMIHENEAAASLLDPRTYDGSNSILRFLICTRLCITSDLASCLVGDYIPQKG